MQSTSSFLRRPVGVLAGATLMLAGGLSSSANAAEDSDPFPSF